VIEQYRLGVAGVLRLETVQVASCLLYLVLWWAATPVRADDALPTGYKADRYRTLWERNPFTLVTPAVQTQPQAFSKLVVSPGSMMGGFIVCPGYRHQ